MTAHEPELRRLMIAGQAGDAAAYRTLLDHLSRHLRGYFKSRLTNYGRSSTDAEDLVQDVIMAIHTRRHTYSPDQLFTPWVHAIARYKLIDHLRRRNTGFADVPLDGMTLEIEAHDDRDAVESGYDLQRLLATLPIKMQQAIRHVKIEGLSIAETAERCDMSESAVKVNIHRGLKKLADMISREVKS